MALSLPLPSNGKNKTLQIRETILFGKKRLLPSYMHVLRTGGSLPPTCKTAGELLSACLLRSLERNLLFYLFWLIRRCGYRSQRRCFWYFKPGQTGILRSGACPEGDWRRQSSHHDGKEAGNFSANQRPHSTLQVRHIANGPIIEKSFNSLNEKNKIKWKIGHEKGT